MPAAVVLSARDGSRVRIDRFPVVLGRSNAGDPVQPDCDLSPPEAEGKVSRRHLALDMRDGRVFATDLGSTNGSWVDGRALVAQQPVELTAHAQLVVGRLALTVALEGDGAPAPMFAGGAVGGRAALGGGVTGAETVGVDDSSVTTFVADVFRLFEDPEVSHMILEPGRRIRLRQAGQWLQAGDHDVSREHWTAMWLAFCEIANVSPSASGSVTALLRDAVMAEAILPPLAVDPVLMLEKRAAPTDLDACVAAGILDEEQAGVLRNALLARQGIVVAGPPGSGRSTLLEALVEAVWRGERVAVVEWRPAIRLASPRAVRMRASPQGAAATVLAVMATVPDWMFVDDADPSVVAAAVRHVCGGCGVVLGARTEDAAAWRNRAAQVLAADGWDAGVTTAAVDSLCPHTVTLDYSDTGFRVTGITTIGAVGPVISAIGADSPD
jgi:predicted ATPase